MTTTSTTTPLLEVDDLTKHFPIRSGVVLQRQVGAVRAVDGVDFSVNSGETLGLVGESGCGKTTTGRMIARLLEPTSGAIRYDGRDIAHLSVRELRPIRGEIQMIFQDPYSSLNPRHTVGAIVAAFMEVQGIDPPGGSMPCTSMNAATIEPTVCRGFSDEYGSWKIIWISPRIGRSSRTDRWAMSRPS